MCGIAGFVHADLSPSKARQHLAAMCDAIEHRGPDDDGMLVQEVGACTVSMGMRRLAIIDTASGKQPISNEDDSVVVVYNGEIYNFQQLRQRLIKKGHTFQSTSDTEVLVHLYEEHGDALVDELHGMFAFAILDRANRRMLLARDRL